jgi:type IV secretory pathway TraG/TraD family ATPase VirD4
VCGLRDDPDQLDMAQLISSGGTLYLLAEPDRMRVIRPLLSLIASEMFLTAEDVARLSGGRAPAFYAVLDELRSGVRVATLPDVASEKRKFRIGYVYACTNGGDEEALYGQADAARLQADAGTSIYGGLDPQSVDDISARAGLTNVVVATRSSTGARSETPQEYQALTTADMQQLADGESVIIGRDLLPFLAFTPALHEIRSMKRAVKREDVQLAARTVTA